MCLLGGDPFVKLASTSNLTTLRRPRSIQRAWHVPSALQNIHQSGVLGQEVRFCCEAINWANFHDREKFTMQQMRTSIPKETQKGSSCSRGAQGRCRTRADEHCSNHTRRRPQITSASKCIYNMEFKSVIFFVLFALITFDNFSFCYLSRSRARAAYSLSYQISSCIVGISIEKYRLSDSVHTQKPAITHLWLPWCQSQ